VFRLNDRLQIVANQMQSEWQDYLTIGLQIYIGGGSPKQPQYQSVDNIKKFWNCAEKIQVRYTQFASHFVQEV
jgi:hypothetical protein